MKDLYSNWMMDWMAKKGIPAHKAYDYVGFLGFGSFFLVLFISIIVQNIELSGWLGMVCGVLFLLIAISLLIVSGYCTYQANYMWLMLLLFGSGDIIMGLAIDLGAAWRIVLTAIGILMTGIGIFLAPKQLRNSKKLKPELEAARTRWELERAARYRTKQNSGESAKPKQESSRPKAQSEIERLKLRLHVLDTMKSNLKKSGASADSAARLKYAEENYAVTAKALGEKLLEQPENRENRPSGQQESTLPANGGQPKAQLKHVEIKDGWKQFDYQWPHRFGYEYMLKSAQWLITHDLQVQTLTTAEIAGAPEQEHIQELQACGNLSDCVGKETGVLAVGGASKSAQCLLKVYWYNQTFVVRIFTLGDVEQNRIDAFTEMLLT